MFLCNGVDVLEIGTLTVEADRNDGTGLFSDGRFNPVGINIVGAGVHIHKNRRPPKRETISAVAMKVNAGTITSSP